MLYSILVPKMTVFLNKDIARDCSSEPFNLGWVNENTISLGDCHGVSPISQKLHATTKTQHTHKNTNNTAPTMAAAAAPTEAFRQHPGHQITPNDS